MNDFAANVSFRSLNSSSTHSLTHSLFETLYVPSSGSFLSFKIKIEIKIRNAIQTETWMIAILKDMEVLFDLDLNETISERLVSSII